MSFWINFYFSSFLSSSKIFWVVYNYYLCVKKKQNKKKHPNTYKKFIGNKKCKAWKVWIMELNYLYFSLKMSCFVITVPEISWGPLDIVLDDTGCWSQKSWELLLLVFQKRSQQRYKLCSDFYTLILYLWTLHVCQQLAHLILFLFL